MSVYARHFDLRDADATRAAGRVLGNALAVSHGNQPVLVTLQGELGAGKTTLVGGLLEALGHTGPVRSPTYTLIEPYELAQRQCYHLDLYRLTDPMQLEELGVRDLMQPGALLLVEWPERAGAALSSPDLAIQLSYPDRGQTGRRLKLSTALEPYTELVHSLSISA